MAIGGAITFILVFCSLIDPLFTFTNQDTRTAYCFGLTCTNTYFGNIIRYSGYFDESGAICNWGIFAILFNKLFFNNRKFEILLVICLALSFSLAFYIQILLYFMLFYSKNLKRLIWTGSVLLIMILSIYNFTDRDGAIYQLTFARFEYDESSGNMKGNSRADLIEKAKSYFLINPVLGAGAENIGKIEYMDDNPYETLAKDGVIGTLFMYIPLLFIIYYGRKNKEILCAIIILVFGYLQRPYHVDLIHPSMLYSFLALVLINKESNIIIHKRSDASI